MAVMGKNILVRAALMACVVMQLAVLMPHHHHDGSAAACINPLHCIQENGCHSHDSSECGHETTERLSSSHECAHGTTHSHDTPGTECILAHIDIAAPERNNSQSVILPAVDIMQYTVFTVGSECDPVGEKYHDALSCTGVATNTGTQSPHTSYISAAIPPRAPSATV